MIIPSPIMHLSPERFCVVNPKETRCAYDQWGKVEPNTLTKEFFMPKFLERDEAIRRKPWTEARGTAAKSDRLGQWRKKSWRGVY